MGTRKSGFYRHDLDGLRGVAIALVAIFHVWFGRVSGGVDVFLALSGFFFGGRLLRAAINPSGSLAPGARAHAVGPAPAPRARRRARRVGGAHHPGSARNPLGDVRRSEPGEPRVLPELGVGQHRVELSAGRRGGQPAAAHLVDVGAGPVLHRVPGADLRMGLPVPRAAGQPHAHVAHRAAERAHRRVVRLRDHSRTTPTSRRPTTTASPVAGNCCSAHWSARWCPTCGGRCGCARRSRWWRWPRSCRAARSSTASRSSPARGRLCPSARPCCSSSAPPTAGPIPTWKAPPRTHARPEPAAGHQAVRRRSAPWPTRCTCGTGPC